MIPYDLSVAFLASDLCVPAVCRALDPALYNHGAIHCWRVFPFQVAFISNLGLDDFHEWHGEDSNDSTNCIAFGGYF